MSGFGQDAGGEIKPAPYQVAWQDLEFGVILHFSTNTFLDREWGDGTASPAAFNPTAFDPEQWMKAIRDSGAKYVVLVAKHHDGFCLWPTEQTTYSVKSSPWKDGKGDVVGDVARAARKYGLKFGVYLSPWDRHDPRYHDSAAYDRYYNAELEELASHYGDLVEFWLDGAGSEGHVYDFKKIIETLRTYQPDTVVFADTGLFEYGDARWVGTEAGQRRLRELERHRPPRLPALAARRGGYATAQAALVLASPRRGVAEEPGRTARCLRQDGGPRRPVDAWRGAR